MKNILRLPLCLLMLAAGLLIFTACGGSTSSSNAPTPDEIKALISSDIEDVANQIDSLVSESANASGQTAAELANNAYALENRLDVVASSFDNDIKDGYITEVEKSDYDVEIAEEKTKLATALTDLTSKAGSSSDLIDPSTKIITVTSKEGLDNMISTDETLLDNFERGIEGASSETKATFSSITSNRLLSVKTALDNLDKLVSEGVITDSEKTTYQESLDSIRDRFESLQDKLV